MVLINNVYACVDIIIDTIDYVQGIGNGPINPLHPCPKPNTFSV